MKKLVKIQFGILKKSLFPSLFATILLALLFLSYQTIFNDKFFPVTYIGDTNITFLTKSQAASVLATKFHSRSQDKLDFIYQGKTYTINLADTSATLLYKDIINEAFFIGRTGDYFNKLHEQFKLLVEKADFTPTIDLDVTNELEKLAGEVDQPAKNAALGFNDQGELVITPSQAGIYLNKDKLTDFIKQYFIAGVTSVNLPVETSYPVFDTEKAGRAKTLVDGLKDSPVKLKYANSTWEINQATILTLINTENSSKDLLDSKKLEEYIKANIASEIDQPVLEPLFKFDGSKVSEFRPSQDGMEVDLTKTTQDAITTLTQNLKEPVTVTTNVIRSKNQTEDINRLGIKDLLGKGISHFAGSIVNRDFNVKLTASRINGVLIPPNEEFSFLRAVGDISTATGFRQAYIIQNGRTVLGDGGGVCQVSTTVFRAALNSGLPITDRSAHAYRVTYYEQGGFGPGLDATVYYPSVDFRFKNDTNSHILIQAYTVGTTLYIDLYGTSDGRVTEVTRPVILSQTPPLPEIRQDDPTLPKGTVKQVDWAAWGAKTVFKRKVVRNGEVIADENWHSNFRPWQAVYLVGTKEN